TRDYKALTISDKILHYPQYKFLFTTFPPLKTLGYSPIRIIISRCYCFITY
ncbi:MAG: hypothetical protein BECKG1743D_GA0114223_105531, partial [Candidatus Kentron sp. G]